MSERFMSQDELQDMTGLSQGAAQIRWSLHTVMMLDELRLLPAETRYCSGIYFLWRDADLLYIGKSRNLDQRLVSHHYAKTYGHLRSNCPNMIPFNRYTCLVVSRGWRIPDGIDDALKPLERAYIERYEPPYNCPFPNPGT